MARRSIQKRKTFGIVAEVVEGAGMGGLLPPALGAPAARNLGNYPRTEEM